METAVRQTDLQWLRQWLQHRLHHHIPPSISFDVRCALKQGNLLVLVQHPTTMALDVAQTFAGLEQALQALDTHQIKHLTEQPVPLPVRLYLRVMGQQQPYADTTFTLTAPAALQSAAAQPEIVHEEVVKSEVVKSEVTGLATVLNTSSTQNSADADNRETPLLAHLATSAGSDKPEELLGSGAASVEGEPHHFAGETVRETSSIGYKTARRSGQLALVSRLASISFLAQIPVPVLVLSSVVGLMTVIGGAFILTRPCVLGECPPLEQAQRLSQQSAQLAHPKASANDVVSAYHQLTEANYLLGTIPPWSPHYEVAQALLQSYGTRSEVYGKVVTALQQANAAANKSQNPPHPLSTWREVQQLWQKAIAVLETVPSDNPIYLLAQEKRSEYQTNLAGINQRIRTEQRSQEQIAAARAAAEAAQIRETNAKSVEGWQSAYNTWQVVVNTLTTVSQGTMAYAEAEQLLAIYQPKLASARNRYTQEKASAEAYSQTLRLAQQARLSEQRRQWSQAVEQWRSALTNASQIGDNSSYHEQIQALIATYETALSTAQANLRTAVVAQDAETLLNQACTGTSTICSYTMGSGAIEVRFTSDYDWAVQAIITESPLPGSAATQQALREYINSLLQTFATVSQTAQKPIDFYNAEDQIFATYDVQLGGYAQR
jgi:hypothetical protein